MADPKKKAGELQNNQPTTETANSSVSSPETLENAQEAEAGKRAVNGTPLPEHCAMLYPGQTVESVLSLLETENCVLVPKEKIEKVLSNNKTLRAMNEEMGGDIVKVIEAFAEISTSMSENPAQLMKLALPGAKNPFEKQIGLFAEFMAKYGGTAESEAAESSEEGETIVKSIADGGTE